MRRPGRLARPHRAADLPLERVIFQNVALRHAEAGETGLEAAEHILVLKASAHRVKRAEQQRADDLNEWREQNACEAELCAVHRAGNTEGYGKCDETHRVVERDDRQQQIRQLALGLVLAHDHQRRRRCGGCGDRAECDGRRDGQHVGAQEVEDHERNIDKGQRGQRLQDADNHRLPASLFELAQAEFIADGKGDEAHRHIGDHAQRLDLVVACKAEARNAEAAQHERSDQNARHKKRRDIGQVPAAENTGHQKPCEQRNGQIQNRSHGYTFTTEKVRANRAAQGSYCSLFVRKKQALFCKFPVKVRKNGSFLGKSCHFVSFHTIQSVFARTPAK